MHKIRELIATIGKNIIVPELCPVHPDVTVDESGFCATCNEDHFWDYSVEELKKRIELLFLIHQPTMVNGERVCSECGREFPCPTLTALDGMPADIPVE